MRRALATRVGDTPKHDSPKGGGCRQSAQLRSTGEAVFSRIRTRLSYADVMASAAVVIALGAAVYAISQDEQPRSQITLGELSALNDSPRAKNFALGQTPHTPQAWNNIGDSDGPPLNYFESFFVPPHNPPAFVKDRDGFVHLRGLIVPGDRPGSTPLTSGTQYTLFTLPPGFRPEHQEVQGVLRGDGGVDRIDITTAGAVVWGSKPNQGDIVPYAFLTLDGITFRAAE